MTRRTVDAISPGLVVAVFDGARLVGARQTGEVAPTSALLEDLRHTGLRALPLSPAAQAVWQAREHADAA